MRRPGGSKKSSFGHWTTASSWYLKWNQTNLFSVPNCGSKKAIKVATKKLANPQNVYLVLVFDTIKNQFYFNSWEHWFWCLLELKQFFIPQLIIKDLLSLLKLNHNFFLKLINSKMHSSYLLSRFRKQKEKLISKTIFQMSNSI